MPAKPMAKASIIASIEARTEVQPFTAQAQGMSPPALSSSHLIPAGKGIPISMPKGKRINIPNIILAERFSLRRE